jgi:hypothetical protein
MTPERGVTKANLWAAAYGAAYAALSKTYTGRDAAIEATYVAEAAVEHFKFEDDEGVLVYPDEAEGLLYMAEGYLGGSKINEKDNSLATVLARKLVERLKRYR